MILFRLPAPFNRDSLLAAAHTFFAKEDEDVEVEYVDSSNGVVDRLPFVNRVVQLDRAARALLHNTSTALRRGGDTQRMELVLCSQLFGVGKTTFAERLADGLNIAFEGKLSYARLVGVPVYARDVDAAVAQMVLVAAEKGKVISRAEADVLFEKQRLSSVLGFVQERLATNACVPGAISQLFLHFDEFNLSASALLRAYPTLRNADTIARYDDVWGFALVPILQTPNLHLVVTGKPPELAILATRDEGQSPTLVYHAVLGTLSDKHIIDILHRLKVRPALGAPFVCAYVALGLPMLSTAPADDPMDDSRWFSFVRGLHYLTAGVPRFVCIALGHVVQMRSTGQLRPLSELTPSAIAALFYATSPLTAAMINGDGGRFITGPIDSLKLLLSDATGEDKNARELLELMINVYGRYTVPLNSNTGRSMIQRAARFGAYIDHVPPESATPEVGSEMIRLVMPGILQQFWQSPEVLALFAAKLPGVMRDRSLSFAASAGSLGDALESRFQSAFDLHWAIGESKRETSPDFLRLLRLSGRLHGVDIDYSLPVARESMGRVGNAGASKMCANVHIPRLLSRCLVGEARHVLFTPLPQSHSADRMCSLAVRAGGGGTAAGVSPLPSNQRALLLGFALKNYADEFMSEAVVHREICNFADTVYSMTPEQRALYGHRIVLFLFAPDSARKFLDTLMQSGRTIFPLVSGGKSFVGVPNAKGVKFNELLFDVVVVSQSDSDAFLKWCNA